MNGSSPACHLFCSTHTTQCMLFEYGRGKVNCLPFACGSLKNAVEAHTFQFILSPSLFVIPVDWQSRCLTWLELVLFMKNSVGQLALTVVQCISHISNQSAKEKENITTYYEVSGEPILTHSIARTVSHSSTNWKEYNIYPRLHNT